MRAYLRLDPNLMDHKGDYPDGALAAFTLTLCLAEQQPKRGRFKNRKLLKVLLERRGRWVDYLIEHADLVEDAQGQLYVDGWDEWQEGDHTVPDRMRRLRNRKGNGVTEPVTVAGVTVPYSGGGGGKHIAEAEARNGQSPEHPVSMIRWNPKPDRLPGEAVPLVHDGKHRGAGSCLVCQPPIRGGVDA